MLVLATQAHDGQFDKGGRPYILHPLAVMHKLHTDDEELQCIALGHDIIEDTYVTIFDLQEKGFSKRIVDGIAAMTKYKYQTVNEYKVQITSNVDAMQVKKEDLRHNSDIRRLKGVTKKDIERMAQYHKFWLELDFLLRTGA
jgi:(p)ppGpp synthase/HD superfamily hydrolase